MEKSSEHIVFILRLIFGIVLTILLFAFIGEIINSQTKPNDYTWGDDEDGWGQSSPQSYLIYTSLWISSVFVLLLSTIKGKGKLTLIGFIAILILMLTEFYTR
jgi:hypothetical protein